MEKNKTMENEKLSVEPKEDEERHILFMSEIAKSTHDTPTVLKGGTALLLAYKLDRFSEDLDFDSTKSLSLEKRLNESAKKANVEIDSIFLKKNTATTKRYIVNYKSEHGKRRLKIETSLREKEIEDQDTTVINGVRVYKIENLISQKLEAGKNRSKVRDLYDLNYLAENYRASFTEQQKQQLAEFASNPDNLVNRYRPDHQEDNILKNKSLDDLALNITINSELMSNNKETNKPVLLAKKFSQDSFNNPNDKERFISEVEKKVENIKSRTEANEENLER